MLSGEITVVVDVPIAMAFRQFPVSRARPG